MSARLVLIVGSPRSGTTWLQSLLGAHSLVATPQETDLFRVYLAPLADAWDQQVAAIVDASGARRQKGLPTVLTTAQFEGLGRGFVTAMVDSVLGHKPAASVVIEKSPGHSMTTDVVLRFAPDATFVHLVRDGRDVAASLVAASRTFGEAFAPRTIGAAARMWKSRLLGARSAADAPGGYVEVRYEDLHRDGPATLKRAYAVCGIDASADECLRTLERFEFEAMASSGAVAGSIVVTGEAEGRDQARREPAGFFRKGVVGSWRDEWTDQQRLEFDSIAGDLLIELGYEPDRTWAGSGTWRRPLRDRAPRLVARVLRSTATRIEGIAPAA